MVERSKQSNEAENCSQLISEIEKSMEKSLNQITIFKETLQKK